MLLLAFVFLQWPILVRVNVVINCVVVRLPREYPSGSQLASRVVRLEANSGRAIEVQ